MFPASYFPKRFFPGRYFPPVPSDGGAISGRGTKIRSFLSRGHVMTQANDGSAPFDARVPSRFVDVSAVTITTIATVVTPTSGKRFRLLGGSISSSTAISVLFEDNSAGASQFVYRTPKLLVDTPYDFDLGPKGVLLGAINNLLKATGSGAGVITGTLWGTEE